MTHVLQPCPPLLRGPSQQPSLSREEIRNRKGKGAQPARTGGQAPRAENSLPHPLRLSATACATRTTSCSPGHLYRFYVHTGVLGGERKRDVWVRRRHSWGPSRYGTRAAPPCLPTPHAPTTPAPPACTQSSLETAREGPASPRRCRSSPGGARWRQEWRDRADRRWRNSSEGKRCRQI
jgi:hypothetical protein